MGLNEHDLFNDSTANNSHKTETKKEYLYRDINGKTVFKKIRYENKKFAQARLDENGKWVFDLKGVKPVLYQLPELIKAISEQQTIFIVEGEKDVETLRIHNKIATCSPFGAGKGNNKWNNEYAMHLANSNAVIISDNDDIGKEFARKIADSLVGVAKSVKLIDLTKILPSLQEHGDITDMVNIMGKEAINELDKLIAITDEYSLQNKSEENTGCGLIKMSSVEPQDIQWLWKPYIPLGKITLMRGDPGQGKTTVSLTLASIVSNGWAFPTDSGFVSTEPGNVLYISAEDGLADTIAPRLIKARANLEMVFSYKENSTEQLSFMNPKFENLIKESKAKLVIVDPIQGYLGSNVDGHKANEVRPVMSHIGALAEKYNCAIVLIEHMSKNIGTKGLYRGLGSIDTTAAARSVLLVGSNPEDETDKGISQIKSNLAKPGKVIGFSISDERGLEWKKDTTLTTEKLLGLTSVQEDKQDNALEEAKEFLEDVLADNKQSSKDIHAMAVQYGISKATLKRAKEALNIDCKERDGFGKNITVYWKLPNSNKYGRIEKVTPKEKAQIINLFEQPNKPLDTK